MSQLYDARLDPDGSGESVLAPISAEEVYGPLSSFKLLLKAQVNAERDKRIEGGFDFNGHLIQSRATDRENIAALAADAERAIAGGKQAGDYAWHPRFSQGFGFIVEDNSVVPMDAFDMRAMRERGFAFKADQTFYAVSLKAAIDLADDYATAAAVVQDASWPE